MAIKTSTSTVIVDKDYIHPSFDYTAGQDGAFLAKINGAHGTGAAALDNFGYSVAVGSGRIVVGARYDADNGSSSGSAYIFDLNGNFINKIDGTGGTGAATFDYFGQAVAVGSGRIVVGAHADDDNGLDASGSAYIFDLEGNFINKINGAHGTGANAGDYFGLSVAVGSDRIVVTARYDDDNGSNSGSAYIFDLDGNFINKINGAHGTGAGVDDYFGTSVAVGSGRVVVGAYLDDDNGDNSGSAYIFTTPLSNHVLDML